MFSCVLRALNVWMLTSSYIFGKFSKLIELINQSVPFHFYLRSFFYTIDILVWFHKSLPEQWWEIKLGVVNLCSQFFFTKIWLKNELYLEKNAIEKLRLYKPFTSYLSLQGGQPMLHGEISFYFTLWGAYFMCTLTSETRTTCFSWYCSFKLIASLSFTSGI